MSEAWPLKRPCAIQADTTVDIITPMRIACVVEEFPVLSETFILNQITGLIERGHDVDLFAFDRRDASEAHPDVHRLGLLERTRYAPPLPASKPARLLSALNIMRRHGIRRGLAACSGGRFGHAGRSLRLIHEAEPFFDAPPYDVVHCHFGQVGAKVARLRELGLMPGPLVTTFYGFDISQRVKMSGPAFYTPLFNQAVRILALSDVMRKQLLDIGCPKEKVRVHHLGADANRFSFLPRTPSLSGRVEFVSVARLAEKKGLEYAIRAIAKVMVPGMNVRYRIVGEGPLRDQLAALIAELGVSNVVQLLGKKRQDEVVQILNESHILLAPSVTAQGGDQEGTPTAIAEAMLMGLPVLSTRHSGIPEMVRDGVTGHLVPERDVDTLATRMREMIAHPEQWRVMGAAGRAYANEQFSIHSLNDRLVMMYRELIGSVSS